MNLDKYDFNTFENYLYNLSLDYINNKAKKSENFYDLILSDQSADVLAKKILSFYVREDFELEFNNKKTKFLTKIKNINNIVIKDYIFRDYNSIDIKMDNNSYFGDKISLYKSSINNVQVNSKTLRTHIMSDSISFSNQFSFFSFSRIEDNIFDYIIKSNKRDVFEQRGNLYDNMEDSKVRFDNFLNKIKESFFESLSLKITMDEYGIKFSNILDNLTFFSEMNILDLELKKINFDKNGFLPKKSIFEDQFIKEVIIDKKISEKSIKNDVINSIDMISLTQDIDYSSLKDLLLSKKNISTPSLKKL